MALVLTLDTRKTPLGELLLVTDADGTLRAADFVGWEDRLHRLLGRRLRPSDYEFKKGRTPATITRQLEAYFDGKLGALREIRITAGGTTFQETVWTALRDIAPGRPTSYSSLARLLDRPHAARAVGHANATNPFCIVVPCHRLVGAAGGLTGYSGGVERKRWLLDHEAKHSGM